MTIFTDEMIEQAARNVDPGAWTFGDNSNERMRMARINARAALAAIEQHVTETVEALREREWCSRYQSGSVRRCSACRKPADDARKIEHAKKCPFHALTHWGTE